LLKIKFLKYFKFPLINKNNEAARHGIKALEPGNILSSLKPKEVRINVNITIRNKVSLNLNFKSPLSK
jgi:hypothetical protein